KVVLDELALGLLDVALRLPRAAQGERTARLSALFDGMLDAREDVRVDAKLGKPARNAAARMARPYEWTQRSEDLLARPNGILPIHVSEDAVDRKRSDAQVGGNRAQRGHTRARAQ